ncbi:MAG TPA: hypothetical protein VGS07_14400 [Thermoanaerobaculia bacterium]|nr:hypothetical protein [Thermoanaerobaculia bacterium]
MTSSRDFTIPGKAKPSRGSSRQHLQKSAWIWRCRRKLWRFVSSISGSQRDSTDAAPTSAEVGVDLEMPAQTLEIFFQHLWKSA